MFNSIEYIRNVCRQRKIPISQLEKDCGFGNGYLNPKKQKKLPYDRAVAAANYLDIPVNIILTGEEEQKEPPTTLSNSEGLRSTDYDKLNEANRAIIDDLIAKLVKAQSEE
jgi:hypothetical protein